MWDKIRHARLFRVLVVYLGAAWVVLQVTETIQDGFGMPDWVMPLALVLLLIGLLVVMGTALVQAGLTRLGEGTDSPDSWAVDLEGLKRSLLGGRLPHLTWGRALLGGVVAFSLLFGVAGAYVLVTGKAPSLPLVAEAEAAALPAFAVLPFRVSGGSEDLSLWREGMVDLLSTNLESVVGIRKTDPTAILSRWRRSIGEGRDAASSGAAYGVAEDLGAWYALSGTLVGSGQQVRASVEVYDTRSDRVLGTAQVDGSPDDVLDLIDRLSLEILRAGLVPIEGDHPQFDISRTTTNSLDGMKAYLEGEQLYRRSRFSEAADAFTRAVTADSTFAMAWYRLATAYSWLGERPQLVTEAIGRAHGLVGRLHERERLLVTGFARFLDGDPGSLVALRELTDKYPDDVEGWAVLGDAHFHQGGQRLLSMDGFRSALHRAIELDPSFGPAYVHLIEDSFAHWDSVGTRALIDQFAQIDADTPVCGDFEWAYAMLWGDAGARADALVALEREGTARPACSLTALPATPAFLADLLRSFEALHTRGVPQNPGLAGVSAWKAGRVREARRLWDLQEQSPLEAAREEAFITLLTYDDPDSRVAAEAVLARDAEAPDYFWLAQLSADRGDFDAASEWLDRHRGAAERAAQDADEEWQRVRALALADANGGLVAVRRGNLQEGVQEVQDALARIAESGGGGPHHLVLRYEVGKALLELGRADEAVTYFETFTHFDGAVLVQAWLHLGHAFFETGRRDEARRYYELFAKSWVESDPELAPLLEEAEAALAGLGSVADDP